MATCAPSLARAVAVVVLVVSPLHGQGGAAPVMAFRNVHVLPMDRDTVLRGYTVVVRDGRISSIGPARYTPVPAGAQVVDGGDTLFLAPGIADMHAHVDSVADLIPYLRNGITTIFNYGPELQVSRQRARIAAGDIPGPQVFVVRNFQGDGNPTPEQGRAMVDMARDSGEVAIKVYSFWPPESFRETMRYARQVGFPVVGHGVRPVGMQETLDSGVVMIAHAEEFLYTYFNRLLDPARIPEAIALVKARDAWVTANLSAYEALARQTARAGWIDSVLASPEGAVLNGQLRAEWRQSAFLTMADSIRTRLERRLGFLQLFVKAMSDSGVPLLAGTDGPALQGMLPGYAMHNELRTLLTSGLSPYQALSIATRNAGLFMQRIAPRTAPFGTITAGSRADLVLLDRNPLTDLCSYADPSGVMAGGRWYPGAELESMLTALIAARHPERAPPRPRGQCAGRS